MLRSSNHFTSYRPDIDGLRAFAVLAVIIFHINPAILPGGFAGVDVFFVISGFLITRNLLNGLEGGRTLSIAEFYRRRALRILPVLFLVVLVTLILGHFILQPNHLLNVAWSSLASVFAAANIYFAYFIGSSYFSDDASFHPLLHLWSLGIEEQFYFLWPFFVLALSRIVKIKLSLLLIFLLLIISVMLGQFLLEERPMFAFYMLPTRASGLLTGAILAFMSTTNTVRMPTPVATLATVVGIIGVTYSFIWLDSSKGFPGVNALPSIIGTLLIILGGFNNSSAVTRVLSCKLLVFIGVISYSLYLWHWPLLVYYRYLYGFVEFGPAIVLIGLMFLLSIMSYHWVETPMRTLRWNFLDTFIKAVIPAVICLSALSIVLIKTNGFGLYAFNEKYRSALEAQRPVRPAYSYPYVCQRFLLNDSLMHNKECIINSSSEPSNLLWGDSHAAHYIGVIGAIAKHAGGAFRNIAHSSCPPLLRGGEHFVLKNRRVNCIKSIELVKANLGDYSRVILGGAWETYFSRDENFIYYLEQTLIDLTKSGKKVVILGQLPKFKNIELVKECGRRSLKFFVPKCGDFTLHSSLPALNQSLRTLASKYEHVSYFDVNYVLCEDGECRNSLDGIQLYFDGGHLSMEGSWALGKFLVENEKVPNFLLD